MAKFLGLDLGTNSIGWAIRINDLSERAHYLELYKKEQLPALDESTESTGILDNEIVDFGAIVFKKGVGDGKSGEYSLAAERRKNRSKRRLYNAKRYRKWALLKLLIENKMCPLSIEELQLWSIGSWKQTDGKWKNTGRIYPVYNQEFQDWLSFDPTIFGNKGVSDNDKLIRKNPYDLRCELIEKEEIDERIKKLKVGRALYHLVQRRGFKSSRKSGQSTYAKNEEIESLKEQNPDFQIAFLAKERIDKGLRFRQSGVIQRKYFEDEFQAICDTQKIEEDLKERLYKAIYFVRPLRSQKGLVGNCTLEKGKTRIPISHPRFEEFRALQFINNIKWREAGTKTYVALPIYVKRRILEELFFRKVTAGKNKGKISEDTYFDFNEIVKRYSEDGKYEFNFKNVPNVSTCPIIASLMNVFDIEWKNKFIVDEKRYGISWDDLVLNYTVKYGKKAGESRTIGFEEIWHLLFDYIQIKDKQDELEDFCKNVLLFDDEKAKAFAEIDVPQGYGALSKQAITKILPFLQQGYIYSEAVLFGNLKNVLGNVSEKEIEKAKDIIEKTIKETTEIKERYSIVNNLIFDYFKNNEFGKAKGVDDVIKELAEKEILKKIINTYGAEDWKNKPDTEKETILQSVLDLYLRFLDGKQSNEEKASAKTSNVLEVDYYKLPSLDSSIKTALKGEFGISDRKLENLYHPSDIQMYPPSKTHRELEIDGEIVQMKFLESPQPPSRGWKNPMAMRTLHELRYLLNYLLKTGKIDDETKVIVEMARELNDSNKRKAIQTYQKQREEENKEFAKAIVGVVKEKYPNVDENDINNINKVRLWWEQIENNEEKYREIKSLKEDIQKYRLWKEQECKCMYTGKLISITKLFDGTQTQIMHTFPASVSFDNSLANLTVGDAYYNTEIQGNKIPTQLPNYSEKAVINGVEYEAINRQLEKWKLKVANLKNKIEENKKRSRQIQDPEKKKENIQTRHLLQFDYEYWKKKVDTFTLNEIPPSWKNSQLVDTQIITRYAVAYLKTVFKRVYVQKGVVVNDFKNIYQIKGDEQKDRSKHSHHIIDAAVLTLIPGSAQREVILENYYSAIEKSIKYYDKPYKNYTSSHVLKIEDNVVIKHVSRERTLTQTIKEIRKRNKKTGQKAQGKSIRGQINEESYLGAIIPPYYENNKAIKEGGKWKMQLKSNGEPEIWIVKRIPINEVNFNKDVIVDQQLAEFLKQQIDQGVSINELKDFKGNTLRRIRCRVKTGKGFQSKEKTIELKEHTYKSEKIYKQNVKSKVADNFLLLYYQLRKTDENNSVSYIRQARILSLFDFIELGFRTIKDIWSSYDWNIFKKEELEIPLHHILREGIKVIFFEKSIDELKKLTNAQMQKRVFVIYKFNDVLLGNRVYNYIYFKNHIDARPNPEIDKVADSKFNSNLYQAGLRLTPENMHCIFEYKEFTMAIDGSITLHF